VIEVILEPGPGPPPLRLLTSSSVDNEFHVQVRRSLLSLSCAVAALLAAAPARALDKFEIQVYEGDHAAPGQASLELHTNYTIVGHALPDYEGETPADRTTRLTLEPAIGVTDWLELGGYLQGMGSQWGGLQFAGFKLRAKAMVPERARLPVTLGLNVEVGRVPRSVEEDGWANEFRPILGVQLGLVRATVNPLFGFPLTGDSAFKPDFEPAGKLSVDTTRGFSLGVEYYSALGRFDQGLSPVSEQEHLVFAVFDLVPPPEDTPDADPWELDVGLGRSLTDATPQTWVAKVIVGHALW
jgi:hypothetical protein